MPKRLPTIESKKTERSELEKLIDEFEVKGGSVIYCPPRTFTKNDDNSYWNKERRQIKQSQPQPQPIVAKQIERRKPKRERRQYHADYHREHYQKDPQRELRRQALKLLLIQPEGITAREVCWAMNYRPQTNVHIPQIAKRLGLQVLYIESDHMQRSVRYWCIEI